MYITNYCEEEAAADMAAASERLISVVIWVKSWMNV